MDTTLPFAWAGQGDLNPSEVYYDEDRVDSVEGPNAALHPFSSTGSVAMHSGGEPGIVASAYYLLKLIVGDPMRPIAPDTNAAYLKSWFDEATETPGEKAGFLSDVATRAIQCGESTEVEAHKFFSMVNEDRNRGLQDLSSGQLTYEQQASMWEQPGSAASQVLDRVLQSAWYTNFDRTRLSNQASGPEVETVTRMFAQPSLEQTMANAAPGAPGLCRGGTRQTSTVAISEFKWATSQAQRDRVRAEIESTCEQLRSRATSTGRSSRALSQFEAALKAESTAATTTEYVKRNLVGFTLNADESYIKDYKTGDEEFDGWLDRIVVRNNEWVSETNPSLKESRRQALDNELDSTSEWFNWTLDP